MVYEVRLAVQGDWESICALYASARKFMQQQGNSNQWGEDKPDNGLILEDLTNRRLHLLTESGNIHGVFALIDGEDSTYNAIFEGDWRFREQYGAIHRVASDGSGGIFSAVVAYAERKYHYLRVDTHEDNKPMQRAIQNAGFVYCGIILTEDGTSRLAYDRKM